MEAGQQLFDARQRRGLTLADISRTTKIPISLLQAIERNDTTRLPQAFFTRTFVRAYAKEVGLDADALADSVQTSDVELLPVPQPASVRIDDRTSPRSFIGVVALCAACVVYSGLARQTRPPETPQVAAESTAQRLPANAVTTAAPLPCVAAPPPPATVQATHRRTMTASTEDALTNRATPLPVVKHAVADDPPISIPADEAPATTPDSVDAPADQNPAPTAPPAEQL